MYVVLKRRLHGPVSFVCVRNILQIVLYFHGHLRLLLAKISNVDNLQSQQHVVFCEFKRLFFSFLPKLLTNAQACFACRI